MIPYMISEEMPDTPTQRIYMSESQFSMRLLHSYLLLITKLTTPNGDKIFLGFIL